MSSKIEKLFKQINMDKYLEYFSNSDIDRIVVFDKSKLWEFDIKVESNIPTYIYNYLNNKLAEAFNIENIILVIIPNDKGNKYLEDYFKLIIDNIILSSNKYNVFKDREFEIKEDSIEIKVYNKVEKAYLLQVQNTINNKLLQYGYTYKLNIVMDETKEDEIKREIEEDKIVNET